MRRLSGDSGAKGIENLYKIVAYNSSNAVSLEAPAAPLIVTA